jgi:hypothetical protein
VNPYPVAALVTHYLLYSKYDQVETDANGAVNLDADPIVATRDPSCGFGGELWAGDHLSAQEQGCDGDQLRNSTPRVSAELTVTAGVIMAVTF